VHVDAAASAAVLALTRGAAGAYNVVDDGSPISNLKARRELAWDPAFRL
jgi:nucleoside-diphosphate-sugar epimerase